MLARFMLTVALVACAGWNPAQAEWTATVLHRFVVSGSGSEFGYSPRLGVLRSGGDLFGVSTFGGVDAGGVVYQRDSGGTMRVVYSFKNGDREGCGYNPSAALIRQGSNGPIYGTTFFGGTGDGGVVFRLNEDSPNTWSCKALKSFVKRGQGRRGGNSPFGGLLLHPVDKMLYGTVQRGGANNSGAIFRLSRSGANYEVLYSFSTTGNGGYGPASALAVDSNGVMYGTTFFGGSAGGGTVYRINRAGTFKPLHQFNSNNDRKGQQPTQGPLLIDGATGTLYGATTLGGCPDGDTTCGNGTATTPAGVLFSMKKSGAGYKVLHTFDSSNPTEGYGPYGGLIMNSGGALFGVAQFGGTGNGGVAFRYANGNYVVLRSFDPGNDGSLPSGGLVLEDDGSLIGTNFFNGGDRGTLFQIQP